MSNKDQQPDFLPEIRVGKIGVLQVHQISDEELTRLGQGSGQSVFLNFGIGILSVAVSFLISLLTSTIDSDRVFLVFSMVSIAGFIGGIILMILWWYTRKPINRLLQEIRERMPPEGEVEPLDPPNS